MQLKDIVKVEEGTYRVSSLACPMCGDVLTTEIAGDKVFAWHNGRPIYEVLDQLGRDEWERFISGYCGNCWNILFG